MKKLISLITVIGLVLSAPALAADSFVTVKFRPEVKPSFVEQLSQLYKANIVMRADDNLYQFKVPPLKTRDQYAELFASMGFVEQTHPAPKYKVADHITPQVFNIQSPNLERVQSDQVVPGQILVRFKPGTSMDDIRFLNAHHDVNLLSYMSKSQLYRLGLPQGMTIEEALEIYNRSGIVEAAKPNYKQKLPPAASEQGVNTPAKTTTAAQLPTGTSVVTAIPLDGGHQMIVDFKAGTSASQIRLFHQIYGTREVEKRSFYSYQIQLPAHLNAAQADRVMRLFPNVIHVQRLYS